MDSTKLYLNLRTTYKILGSERDYLDGFRNFKDYLLFSNTSRTKLEFIVVNLLSIFKYLLA